MRTGQAIGLAAMLLGAGCGRPPSGVDVSVYDYRDTRDLVRFVHGVAEAIRRDGAGGLEALRSGRGTRGEFYVYVYDRAGECLFHAGMPELERQNLAEVRDVEGKPVQRLVLEALEDPENPHGWVHYTWWEPGKFYPVPKSSCHFRVTLPDGREGFVGGGLDHPHEEREFIRVAVDGAVRRIEATGRAALAALADPALGGSYREVRVFAFRPDGRVLLSPVLGDSRIGLDLTACRDEVGHRPFQRAVQQLEEAESAWQIFMARARGERQLVKKVLYLRKAELEGEPLYVGAVTDLPRTP